MFLLALFFSIGTIETLSTVYDPISMPIDSLDLLSKSAKKRERNVEAYVQHRREQRAERKERQRAARQRSRQAWEKQWELMTETERAQHCAAAQLRVQHLRSVESRSRSLLESCFFESKTVPFRCVIDFGLSTLMTDKELHKSMVQIRQVYVVNKRKAKELALKNEDSNEQTVFSVGVCGIDERCRDMRDKVLHQDWCRWPSVHWLERDVEDLAYIEPCRLVYLTSDAQEELESVEAGTIYVIGGMVDRNRFKGATWKRAQALYGGVRTARLPLDRYASMGSSSRVLATCHVFEILLEVATGESLERAIDKVLPLRKRANPCTPLDTSAGVAVMNADSDSSC